MQIEFAFGVKSAFSLDTNALNDYFTLFIKICKYVDGRVASICVTEILLVVLGTEQKDMKYLRNRMIEWSVN